MSALSALEHAKCASAPAHTRSPHLPKATNITGSAPCADLPEIWRSEGSRGACLLGETFQTHPLKAPSRHTLSALQTLQAAPSKTHLLDTPSTTPSRRTPFQMRPLPDTHLPSTFPDTLTKQPHGLLPNTVCATTNSMTPPSVPSAPLPSAAPHRSSSQSDDDGWQPKPCHHPRSSHRGKHAALPWLARRGV